MIKNNIRCMIAVILIITILAGCSKQLVEEPDMTEEVIVLRFGHYAIEDHPANTAAALFAENVEKRTNGKVIVEIFADGQLGTPPEMLEQNIIGSIDMSLPTQGALDKYSKKFATVMLPFVFDNHKHAYRVLDGEFIGWVKDDLDKQGLIMLANWEYGFRNITNNTRPIVTPDDIVGLRLRTPPEMQLQLAMESLGANVTKIAFPEIYLSLKQGIVDGQENPVSVIYYNKLYEVQKYLTMTRHTYNCMVHVISKKTWETLTKEQQEIILEESIAAGNWMREEVQKEEVEILKKLEDEGMIITYPDRSVFKEKMKYAYNAISTYAGIENVEYFLQLVEESR
ncbi:MAG: C4-dicarboxylate ABC transporter substrate-binding protein [Firmicutes bacterium HGW-Firmicutes-2]|nr:MAG: C4-dicarboxylate ABC transporter substrate-binding protein [Firmicutes bacterium HGW-Firmicutes-2]